MFRAHAVACPHTDSNRGNHKSGPAGCVLNVLVPEDLERLVLVSTSYGESLMGRHLSSAFFLS